MISRAIAFAAPHLVSAWGVAPGALGPVFSASLVGILFGSAIFGWVGDRYGRKAALIGSNLLFGVFTLAAAYATNLEQMFWLRLFAGLGIGGVIPERRCHQRRIRAASSAGDAGDHCGRLRPDRRRHSRLCDARLSCRHTVGRSCFRSAASCRSSSGLRRFSVCRNRSNTWRCTRASAAGWKRSIAAIRPDFKVPPERALRDRGREAISRVSIRPICFAKDLALITPLLWLLFALNLMGYFFLLSWTPTLMTAAKLPPATARARRRRASGRRHRRLAALCGWLQRHRFLAIAIMFVLAVPVVGAIGFAGLTSQAALLTATFFAGFLVLGIQSGINVVGAMIYPTSLRANGSGWQLGIGRIGSIVGPLVGAVFVGLPVQHALYVVGAAVRRRGGDLLHHPSAQHGAACSAA